MKDQDYNTILDEPVMNSRLISSIFLLVYLIVDLLRLFEIIPLFFGNSLYVLVGSIAIIYSINKNGIRKQLTVLWFIFFYTFFGALGILSNGNINIQELLWPFAFAGMALLFLNFTINYKLAKALYYIVSILLMVNIISSGGVDNLNLVTSRNTIGIMLLFYFSIYAISSYTNNQKITLYPIILGLVVTIMAVGRSGILTFSLLIVLFLLFKYDGKEYKIRNPVKSVFVLIICGIILWISYYFMEFYFAQTISNFQNRGLESIRILIWHDYINKTFTSVKHLFFGTPISGTLLLDRFNNNLHNSFFMLHAKYGIVALITVIVLILNAFIYFIKTNNVVYFILLLALLFRMQFDYTNFNAQSDIILFYLMFSLFIQRKYNIRKKRTVRKV